MKIKEHNTMEEKELYEKMLIINTALEYDKTGSIDKTLDVIDEAIFEEEKIEGFAERVNYFADKIRLAAKLLALRKIYEDNKYTDIIAVADYIEKQIEKLRKEVK